MNDRQMHEHHPRVFVMALLVSHNETLILTFRFTLWEVFLYCIIFMIFN